ncbi:MAG: DUF6175 family protein [Acidobacteriota bacterium]
MKYGYVIAATILFTLGAAAQSQPPVSREATFIEANGEAEVLVRAKGIGAASGFFGFDEEGSVKNAENDARKAAVYFVLNGGSGLDGILKSPDEKRRFAVIESDFWDDANVAKFISWEATGFENRVKMAGGEKIRLEKQFRVNRRALIELLVERHIIASVAEMTEEAGLPTIMALPDARPGASPLDLLRSDAVLRQAASAIESYLTYRKYDVIAPDQAEQIYQQQKGQMSLKGKEEDLSYAIALSAGSDIYFTYTVSVDARRVGSSDVRKASVSVRAYETTTARLLGTETGYSEESAAPAAALVEAAVTNALNNVVTRVNAYWKDDANNGQQFKVIFAIAPAFDEDAKYDIADAAAKTLKKLCSRSKENLVSDKTIDYLVWITDKDLQSPSGFFRELRKEFTTNFAQGKLRQVTMNRKLMMVSVEQ